MTTRADTLKVALVGANASGRGWGPAAHMPAIAAVEGLELVALCTSSPASASAAGAKFGIPRVYGDVRELAAQSDIDMVAVAVRVPHHHSIVMPLLEAGKHVYCEWPLGATTDEAGEMTSAAQAMGVTTVAGLQGRHDPAIRHLKRLVADGWLGDVLSVNLTMIGGGALAHRANEAWMARDENGVNTMTVVVGHTLDHVEYVFGRLTEVSAKVAVQVPQWRLVDSGEIVDADAPDDILLTGMLTGGGLLSFRAASVPYNGSGWRMEAYGTEGTLVASTAALPQITPISLLGARGHDSLVPIEMPKSGLDGPAVLNGPGHNVARAYDRMAHAIRTGTRATPDFGEALHLHRLLDAIRRSSSEQRTIGVAT